MTIITINDQTEIGKTLIEFLKKTYSSEIVVFSPDSQTVKEVKQAIKEIKQGKCEPIENFFTESKIVL